MTFLPQIEIATESLPPQFDQIDHSLFPKEHEALIALMKMIAPRTVIEFGVNRGGTARVLLAEVPSIQHYIGVDVPAGYVPQLPWQLDRPPWPGELVAHDRRFELRILPHGSLDLTAEVLPKVDAVFIDGDHGENAVLHDSKLALEVVNRPGLIVWHDYEPEPMFPPRTCPGILEVLHRLRDAGHDIKHVAGTRLAFVHHENK